MATRAHLDAIAVMHVPIEDHHAAEAQPAARDRCRDAHVVDQTEAHGLLRLTVVTWRAGDGERVA